MTLKRLRELREDRHLSQQALADLLHTTQQNIYKYENDLTEPDADMLMAMASLFHTSVDYLISFDPGAYEDLRHVLSEDNSDYTITVPGNDETPYIKSDELHLLVTYNQCREPIRENVLCIIEELAKAGMLKVREA